MNQKDRCLTKFSALDTRKYLELLRLVLAKYDTDAEGPKLRTLAVSSRPRAPWQAGVLRGPRQAPCSLFHRAVSLLARQLALRMFSGLVPAGSGWSRCTSPSCSLRARSLSCRRLLSRSLRALGPVNTFPESGLSLWP